MLDADRQPDGRVENADTIADVLRHSRMSHGGGMARKRLGAAKAHRQLEDLQCVEKGKSRFFSALDVVGKSRAGTLALRLENRGRRVCLIEEGQIVETLDFRMIAQETSHRLGIVIGALHANSQRLERAA